MEISKHFQSRKPSAIRQAQILFAQRPDRDAVRVVNLAIGNVSRPMHPAMRARMASLAAPGSPFAEGVVKYSASVGSEECQRAMLNVLSSAGVPTIGLQALVTDGGSQAMELMVLGVCGPKSERPLLLFDPAYSNYIDLARRAAVPTVALTRALSEDGQFETPDFDKLDAAIAELKPAALVVIPADNPTGQFLSREDLAVLGRLCVKHDIWFVSDEAYRQLQYDSEDVSSVWALTEDVVPGISGRRISIETASKVWNACGLRIGGLITDNAEFHKRAVAEYTANLCSNVIGQYIFGALADISHDELRGWYDEQRSYYKTMMTEVAEGLKQRVPGIIVSKPQASLYSVLDLRKVSADFDCVDFVQYCAERGQVDINGQPHTLLLAPLPGFYSNKQPENHKRLRMAFVAPPEDMKIVPELFARLLDSFQS